MLTVPIVQACWDSVAWQACDLYTNGVRIRIPSPEDVSPNTLTLQEFFRPLRLNRQELLRLFSQQQLPTFQIHKRARELSWGSRAACLLLFFLSIGVLGTLDAPTFVGVEYKSGNGTTSAFSLPTSTNSFATTTLSSCEGKSVCAFAIPKNMKSPISVYFSIGPFYENSLDFVKTSEYANNSFASDIAYRTFFNDTFELKGMNMSEDDIAWATDVSFIDAWYNADISSLFASWEIAKQHLAVWLRPAAFPECFKLYGRIHQALLENDTLTVIIQDRYPAPNYHKRVWITDWQGDGAGLSWGIWLMVGAALALISILLAALTPSLDADANTQSSLSAAFPYRLPLLPS